MRCEGGEEVGYLNRVEVAVEVEVRKERGMRGEETNEVCLRDDVVADRKVVELEKEGCRKVSGELDLIEVERGESCRRGESVLRTARGPRETNQRASESPATQPERSWKLSRG